MASRDASSSNTIMILSSLKLKYDVMVTTGNKDYGNVKLSNSQAIDHPASFVPPSSDHVPPSVPTKLTSKL